MLFEVSNKRIMIIARWPIRFPDLFSLKVLHADHDILRVITIVSIAMCSLGGNLNKHFCSNVL